MSKICILCVDDEADVLQAVVRDLSELEDTFPIETAESAAEAQTIVDEIKAEGQHLGLIICDQIMPVTNGVAFMKTVKEDADLVKTRKILLTGQASHEDTINAINDASINGYLSKPWDAEVLRERAREQISHFVVNSGIDPLPFMQELDPVILGNAIRQQGLLSDA